MISFFLKGLRSGLAAVVDDTHGLRVSCHPAPPVAVQVTVPFRQYMTDTGAESGDEDMRVNASLSSPTDFWIPAATGRDRWITRLSFEISDQGAQLNEFGSITALTNGCTLTYRRESGEKITIHDALKSNWDFVRLCCGMPAFGTGAGAFRGNNVSGNSEGYIPVLDLASMFGPGALGLRLGASVPGVDQRLTLTVRDDTRSVDSFNVIAYGFDRLIG